jgi:CRP/FNR family transcriptional regulator, cyclic AMP receptor protein
MWSHTMIDSSHISATDLFAGLPPEFLEPIAAASNVRQLRRGDVLFLEGDEPSHLYIVIDGRIAISTKSFDGRESVFALMEGGDLFGEMPLFRPDGRVAGARALEASSVVEVPFEPVRDLYQHHPELLWRVVDMLATRLKAMDTALADSVFLDVTGRTAKRLLELAGPDDSFELPITQEELAGLVGASRERVNKAIASFIRLGWIDQRDRTYVITDRQQLEIRSK